MLYLGNNQTGFHKTALGFPSIKACEAIVYQTSAGLYGFHEMPGDKGGFPGKVETFRQWVQQQALNHGGEACRLFGVINQGHRFGAGDDAEWRRELVLVADKLKFDGPIHGARITKHVGKDDSVYVRFDVVGDNCTIRFKRWKKMTQEATTDGPPEGQFEFYRRQATKAQKMDPVLAQDYIDNPAYDTRPASELYSKVHRIGRTDEGDLNTIGAFVFTVTRG